MRFKRIVCPYCKKPFVVDISRHPTQRFCSNFCGQKQRFPKPHIRFWTKVQKTNGCWIWNGTISKRGYGLFVLNRKTQYAHRISWMFTNKLLSPPDSFVLNRCDVRKCVRPSHLFTGNNSDNLIDAARKGRVGGQKLTVSDILTIRSIYKGLRGQPLELAKRYGVSRYTIIDIARRKIWKHI